MKDDWISDVLKPLRSLRGVTTEESSKLKDIDFAKAKQEILTHIDQIVREVIGEEEPVIMQYLADSTIAEPATLFEPAYMRNKLRQEQLKRWESMK